MISSHNSTRGFIASARAIATRCCWPPDNWSGNASNFSDRPTLASMSRAMRSHSAVEVFLTMFGASITLRPTDRCGKRLNCWNTMPTFWRSSRSCAAVECTWLPSIWIDPSSKVSRPLMVRSSVLLPEPLRPMIATTSPSSMSRSTPFST